MESHCIETSNWHVLVCYGQERNSKKCQYVENKLSQEYVKYISFKDMYLTYCWDPDKQ